MDSLSSISLLISRSLNLPLPQFNLQISVAVCSFHLPPPQIIAPPPVTSHFVSLSFPGSPRFLTAPRRHHFTSTFLLLLGTNEKPQPSNRQPHAVVHGHPEVTAFFHSDRLEMTHNASEKTSPIWTPAGIGRNATVTIQKTGEAYKHTLTSTYSKTRVRRIGIRGSLLSWSRQLRASCTTFPSELQSSSGAGRHAARAGGYLNVAFCFGSFKRVRDERRPANPALCFAKHPHSNSKTNS